MTIFQSAVGTRRQPVTAPECAGEVNTARFTYIFATNFVAASDKLELGALPARARIVDATVIGVGIVTVTAKVGMMSGTLGDKNDARTVGAELFTAAALNGNVTRLTTVANFTNPAAETNRAIGVQLSSDVAGSAGKSITLDIYYTM